MKIEKLLLFMQYMGKNYGHTFRGLEIKDKEALIYYNVTESALIETFERLSINEDIENEATYTRAERNEQYVTEVRIKIEDQEEYADTCRRVFINYMNKEFGDCVKNLSTDNKIVYASYNVKGDKLPKFFKYLYKNTDISTEMPYIEIKKREYNVFEVKVEIDRSTDLWNGIPVVNNPLSQIEENLENKPDNK